MARRLRLLAALAAACLLAACAPPEPIRLGFVGGLSGRVADLGEAGRNGFQLAIEQANAAGGIDGRRIEGVIKDDAQDAERAARATEELAAAKVAAIIGPMTSAMADPVLAVASRAGIPVISPTATTSVLSGKDDFFLRVISDNADYSALSARYHFEKNGVRRVAAVFDTRNRAFTESWLAGFRKVFTALGGTMVAEIPFASGDDADYAGLLKQLLASGPDAVVIVASAVDAARFAQQAQHQAKRPILVAVEWAATERLIELGGRAVDGMFVAQFFDRNDRSPEYVRFRQAYLQRFNSPPGFASVAGYDAAQAVIEALARGKGLPLKQALLERGPFSGAQQPFSFDRFGDARRKTFITVVRDGRFVVLD